MKIFYPVLFICLALCATSCATEDANFVLEGTMHQSSINEISSANVTFTYSVPEEIFRYAEITVAYNNDAGTNAYWTPMLDNTFSVTYNLKKFPVTAPVVFIYETTNRPAYGINLDASIIMNVDVSVIGKDGAVENKTHSESYAISGDLGAAINELQNNVLNRTYAVQISKSGTINFAH